MRKFKCDTCGNTYTAMYCDVCGKSIPRENAVYDNEPDVRAVAESDSNKADTLKDIKNYEERNNYILSKIERNTRVMMAITIASVACGVLSALYYVFAILLAK